MSPETLVVPSVGTIKTRSPGLRQLQVEFEVGRLLSAIHQSLFPLRDVNQGEGIAVAVGQRSA